MAKLGMLVSSTTIVGTIVGALVFAGFARTPDADAGAACKRSDFKTKLVKAACTKGGQAEAKAEMKKWMKANKIKTCNVCHAKLAPDYPLKKDAFKRYKDAGGK